MDEFLDNYITGVLILFLFTALIGFIVMLPKMFLFIAIASWPLGWIVREACIVNCYMITEANNCPKCKAVGTLVDMGRWEHIDLPLATQETAELDFRVPLLKCRNCAHEGISVRKVVMENEVQSWLADANAGWLNTKDTWH